jgi:hypothetical protein
MTTGLLDALENSTAVSAQAIEATLESFLAKQLLRERMRSLPNEVEREQCEAILDAFEDWADEYDLPTSPYVLAAYLIELHCEYGFEIDDLKTVAKAYLYQHDRDVHVPIRAALNFCSR